MEAFYNHPDSSRLLTKTERKALKALKYCSRFPVEATELDWSNIDARTEYFQSLNSFSDLPAIFQKMALKVIETAWKSCATNYGPLSGREDMFLLGIKGCSDEVSAMSCCLGYPTRVNTLFLFMEYPKIQQFYIHTSQL